MSGSTGQKTMGRTLPNVLENARLNMKALGVSMILLIFNLGLCRHFGPFSHILIRVVPTTGFFCNNRRFDPGFGQGRLHVH